MSAALHRAPSPPASSPPTLSQRLVTQAIVHGDRPFLSGAERSWTFGETESAASRLAAFFLDLDIEPGAPVAMLAPSGARAAIAILGALKAGLTPLLLPPTMEDEVLAECFAATRPALIVAETPAGGPACVEAAMRIAVAQESVRFVAGFGDALPKGVMNVGERIIAGGGARGGGRDEPVLILFGGADGKISERAIASLIGAACEHARAADMASGDRLVTPLPLADPAGLATGMIAALFGGCRLALLDAPDAGALRRACEPGARHHLVWPARAAALAADLSAAAPWASLALVRRDEEPVASPRAGNIGRLVDVAAGADGTLRIHAARREARSLR